MPAELCLSLVADTLTLPLTVYLRQNDHEGKQPAPAQGGNPLHAAAQDTYP
jgi:hypothetical protein